MMENHITAYTLSTCPYCKMLKNYFKEKGISYTNVDVADNEQAIKKLEETTGQSGVPQIEINGEWVVGFDPEKIEKLLH